MIFSREREKREKERKNKNLSTQKTPKSLFFLSVVFEFFFFLELLRFFSRL